MTVENQTAEQDEQLDGLYEPDATPTAEAESAPAAKPEPKPQAAAPADAAGDDSPATSPEASGGDVAKGLTRAQQQLAAQGQQVTQLTQLVQQLVQKLEPASAIAPGSPGGKAAAEAQDELAELLARMDGWRDDDTADVATVRQTIAAVKGIQQRLDTQLQEIRSEVGKAAGQSQIDRYWSDWSKQHPNVAGRRDELLDQATAWVAQRYANADEQTRGAALGVRFDLLVEEAEAGSTTQAAPAKPAPKPSVSLPKTKPDRSPDGANVLSPNATTVSATSSDPTWEESLNDLYVPDA